MNALKKTVLITGASSGIGAALAIQFAQNNCEIILLGRHNERLNQIACDCQQYTGNKPLIITMDLTEPNASQTIYDLVKSHGMHVDILINNAGEGLWGDFHDYDSLKIHKLIQLNIFSVIDMTKLFLTDMVAKKSGKIVNIASVYAFTPVPYQSIYAASKAFILSFSLALADEVKSAGVDVTVICPGTIRTNFRKNVNIVEKPSIFSMSPETLAKKSYAAIVKSKLVYIPGFYNWIYVKIIETTPVWLNATVVKWLVYKLRGYKSS